MFYVHKNNGQEIKEKVSFSDDSLIRDSLCSDHTLSIYEAMTETQKELVDKYLDENYPNGIDDLGLEEFMKFEVEQLLNFKDEYLIYEGFLSFDDKKALDSYIEEIITNKESIEDALNNLLEDGWDIKLLKPISELTDKLEEIISAIEDLKEVDEEHYEYRKDDLDAWVNETLEYITNSADPDTQKDKNFTGEDFFIALNLIQTEHLKDDGSSVIVDDIDEVAYDNKKEIMDSCDFLVNFALEELLDFEMKGKKQDEILHIKDYVNDEEALKDFKKYLDNHKDEPYSTSKDLLQYFESSERERYIQKDLMSSFAHLNVRDKHLLDRLYFELYSDSKHKVGVENAEESFTMEAIGYDSPCECDVVALKIDGEDYVAMQFVTNTVSSWGVQSPANWTDWVFFKGTIDKLRTNNEMFLTSYESIKENLAYMICDVYNNEFFEINGHLDENERYDQIEEAVNDIDFDEIIKANYDEQYLKKIVLPKVIEQVKEIEKMSEEERENKEIFKQYGRC